jgi:hyperosmotically inducible periplasmic protein
MSLLWTMASGLVMIATIGVMTLGAQPSALPRDRVAHEIFHELVTLPYYGVFDHLAFQYERGTVRLLGHVTRPTLKSDAERAVKRIPGIDEVVNEIEVLPTSPNDDRIRIQTYRAIYRHDALERYGIRALPPIHIIVKNGNVTLEGSVNSEVDRTIAYAQARGVPGVFSVTNNLQIEN